jgi:two-component system LytT family sensor kinase
MLVNTKLQKEVEVNILKYHLNPHFLYNFLNNLYSMALSKSEKTPDTILMFSQVLQYINISSAKQFVSLNNEISIIKKIIKIFLIKFSKEINIELNIEKNISQTVIEPMILIPLVYNSLIFSDIRENHGFISIKSDEKDNIITFEVRFSHSLNTESNCFDYNADEILKNIQKRLSLKYGNKANIFIQNEDYLTVYVLNIQK